MPKRFDVTDYAMNTRLINRTTTTLIKPKISSFWVITAGFVLVKLLIHFLTSTTYELHRDEMLYFAQGLHPGLGYLSTPPFIGFLAFLVHGILGYSEFGIKLFPEIGRVNNEYFREKGVMVLLCTHPKEHWKAFYARKVNSLKSIYR
jgi:hypothetical protein